MEVEGSGMEKVSALSTTVGLGALHERISRWLNLLLQPCYDYYKAHRTLHHNRVEASVTQGYSLRSTRAEFFEPKPTQLQIACSICVLRPISGT